jgi:hypothetical protein
MQSGISVEKSRGSWRLLLKNATACARFLKARERFLFFLSLPAMNGQAKVVDWSLDEWDDEVGYQFSWG